MADAVDIGAGELQRLVSDAGGHMPWGDRSGPGVLVVDLDDVLAVAAQAAPPVGLPAVVVGTSTRPEVFPDLCDLVLEPGGVDLDRVLGALHGNPIASMALVELLRCSPGMTVAAGLLAESATYGVLQAGSEFRRWRQGRVVGTPRSACDPVLVRRSEGELRLTLNRPSRRNALDVAMRDALAEQLDLAVMDPSIERIVVDGAGPSFCSGGELDEFGSAGDASLAHLVRLERSIGRKLHRLADRTTIRLHGACIGSGIELAAFAGVVSAAADVSIGLPEVRMGLVPGAGGTVSLTRRIGRHRTCRLALTGELLDAPTAHRWGLVDEVVATAG